MASELIQKFWGIPRAGVRLSKDPGDAGDSPVFLPLRYSWCIFLVQQARGMSVTSNNELLKKIYMIYDKN